MNIWLNVSEVLEIPPSHTSHEGLGDMAIIKYPTTKDSHSKSECVDIFVLCSWYKVSIYPYTRS